MATMAAAVATMAAVVATMTAVEATIAMTAGGYDACGGGCGRFGRLWMDTNGNRWLQKATKVSTR